jgi:hypothetical protein
LVSIASVAAASAPAQVVRRRDSSARKNRSIASNESNVHSDVLRLSTRPTTIACSGWTRNSAAAQAAIVSAWRRSSRPAATRATSANASTPLPRWMSRLTSRQLQGAVPPS